jgi:post-segregation antitoxin (ccd killing protein)
MKTRISIHVDGELWKAFRKQSIDLGQSASERIESLIKKELEKKKR